MTRRERMSVIGLFVPALGLLPPSDGTTSSGDRQHLALSYAGLTVGAEIATEPSDYFVVAAEDRWFVVLPESMS